MIVNLLALLLGRIRRRRRMNTEYDLNDFWGLALTDDVAITPTRRVLARPTVWNDEPVSPWEDVGYLKDGVSVDEALDEALEAYSK